MKAQTKSALLLLATLVVGLLVGAVATGAVINHRMDQLRALRDRGGFTERVEAVIEPQDEAQRMAIRDALGRSQTRFEAARRVCAQELRAARDSMKAELAPLLTAEQQTRLDEWLSRDRRRHRRGKSPGSDRPQPERRP